MPGRTYYSAIGTYAGFLAYLPGHLGREMAPASGAPRTQGMSEPDDLVGGPHPRIGSVPTLASGVDYGFSGLPGMNDFGGESPVVACPPASACFRGHIGGYLLYHLIFPPPE